MRKRSEHFRLRAFGGRAVLPCLAVFVLMAACSPASIMAEEANPPLRIMYVGNEGVLISTGGKSVLIDGLHREYGPDYLFPPPELLSTMEAALPPFDTVRVVLVSHVHLDHFHAESVGRHLKSNPRAVLISSAQTMLEIAKGYSGHEEIRDRTREITPPVNERIAYEHDDIRITLLGMTHGGERHWWVTNLGHIVEIGGRKLFHFGDADTAAENFAAFNLPAEKIDVAFIPYWFLLSENGRDVVRNRIGARVNIAVHLPPHTTEEDIASLEAAYPGIRTLVTMKQEMSF